MASITVTFTHPQLTRTETLTVPDAKLVEFADLLRTLNYPDEVPAGSPEGTPASDPTRAKAIQYFAEGMIRSVRETYKRLKDQEAKAAVPAPGEIDA